MHSYLGAVGFSEISRKSDLDRILKDVQEHYEEKKVTEGENGRCFVEMSRTYGYDCGITVCGEYDEEDQFHLEYYFPFFRGTGISTNERVIVEKHADKDSYAGACDDVRIGVTLIFYLLNAGEFLDKKKKGLLGSRDTSVTLSGLALEGKILFPVEKNAGQVKKNQELASNRNRLISAARNGDEDAMESLTMEDMDTYTMISRRIVREDIFTIVDSYFMPYGMECDQYNVMGEITEFVQTTNRLTGERMYQLSLLCNDLSFDVCINEKDLMGIPEVGRRFKGILWLQGKINF